MSDKAKILLVDDHPIVREGLVQLINQEPDLVVHAEADGEFSALQRIAEVEPDLVIVDLALASGDGIDLIKAIRARSPKLPVLVLTMHDEPFYAERAMRAGARGFVSKGEASERIPAAIHQLLAGEFYVSEHLASRLMKRLINGPQHDLDPVTLLSDRELQVFRLIGRGLGTQGIADEIGLSVKTIETYRTNIKRKLDLDNAHKLIEHAIRWMVEHRGA